jgi:hypothetical protein
MSLRFLWQVPLGVLVISLWCGLANAQTDPRNPRPVSSTSGAAGQQLRDLYRSDVGTGLTVSSLNQIALQNSRARTPYVGVPTASSSTGSSYSPGAGVGNASKPFSSYSSSPTVSPYLNLFREDLEGGGDLNYNTLVRPQLQQQQFNQQVQRQNMQLAQRLQSISARSDFNVQGARDQFPTGHKTVYFYHSHFYPSFGRRGR